MSNTIIIPEVVAKVFSFLEARDLAKASLVCKIWRLEARRHLYQDRYSILFSFLKPYLDGIRRRFVEDTPVQFARFLPKIRIFIHAFGLDFKEEMLKIRDKLRAKHRCLKKKSRKLDKKREEQLKIVRSYNIWDTPDQQYNALRKYRILQGEFIQAEDIRFEVYKDLVNFRCFLGLFGTELLSRSERYDIYESIDILDKLIRARSWWYTSTCDIVDYWGDEDPDA